jgi:hypothetical protein
MHRILAQSENLGEEVGYIYLFTIVFIPAVLLAIIVYLVSKKTKPLKGKTSPGFLALCVVGSLGLLLLVVGPLRSWYLENKQNRNYEKLCNSGKIIYCDDYQERQNKLETQRRLEKQRTKQAQ